MFGAYRTYLALLVVMQHIGGVPIIGTYAVFGFYVLSGYLMTLIMHNRYGYSPAGAGAYLANRVLRIYPIYWISIACTMGLLVWLGEAYVSDYHSAMRWPATLSEWLKNLLLLFPNLSSARLTPPAWALTVELFFYVLIGLGLSRDRRVVLAWFAASVLYHVVVSALELDWYHRYAPVYAASLPFATGALIFHYRVPLTRILRRLSGNAWSALPAVLCIALPVNCLLESRLGGSTGLFFYANYVLCSIAIVALWCREPPTQALSRLDSALGDLSYPVYLIHFQAGLVVLAVAGYFGLELDAPSMPFLALALPVILLAARLMVITLERPVEALRERLKPVSQSG